MRTAITAFMLSLNKVLVPFAFALSPGILLLRNDEDGWRVLGWSDIAELEFFVPEVVIPVLGMFLGVYALGVTIIGYQYSESSGLERTVFALSSILLMVPEIPLLLLEGILLLGGVSVSLMAFGSTLVLRIGGLALLVGASQKNRRRETTASPDPDIAAPGDA